MYDFLIKNFDKISLFLKEPVFYVLLIIAFLIGLKFFHTLHQGELAELQLKAERLEALEKKYSKELISLNKEQMIFLKVVYDYQKQAPNNKAVIMLKEGFIFSEEERKPTSINLIRTVFQEEPTEKTAMALSDLILSIPSEYMKLIPEMRFGSPFVVRVTKEGVDKLKEKEVKR
jgi:hypothetical protein